MTNANPRPYASGWLNTKRERPQLPECPVIRFEAPHYDEPASGGGTPNTQVKLRPNWMYS